MIDLCCIISLWLKVSTWLFLWVANTLAAVASQVSNTFLWFTSFTFLSYHHPTVSSFTDMPTSCPATNQLEVYSCSSWSATNPNQLEIYYMFQLPSYFPARSIFMCQLVCYQPAKSLFMCQLVCCQPARSISMCTLAHEPARINMFWNSWSIFRLANFADELFGGPLINIVCYIVIRLLQRVFTLLKLYILCYLIC